MNKTVIALLALVIILGGYTIFTTKNNFNDPLVGTKCDASFGEYNDYKYSCYFFGEAPHRQGIVIRNEYSWPNQFTSDTFEPHRKAASQWKTFTDSFFGLSFKFPHDYEVLTTQDSDKEKTIVVVTKLERDSNGKIVQTGESYTERLKVEKIKDMSNGSYFNVYPTGCLETTETISNKEFKRFDCAAQTNIDVYNKQIVLIREENNELIRVTAKFTDSSYDNFNTEVVLVSLRLY